MNKLAIVYILALTAILPMIVSGSAKAEFEFSNLAVSPQEVECGQSVVISVDISNYLKVQRVRKW
ncbi:hypothetical protein ACFLWS_07415 [Chloroflexota bacterium]